MKFEFEVKEIEYIANVLAAQPYAQVAPLIAKIQEQVSQQATAQPEQKPE